MHILQPNRVCTPVYLIVYRNGAAVKMHGAGSYHAILAIDHAVLK
jgi:hypothetical protein